MTHPVFKIEQLRAFSADGHAYRAFGAVIFAGRGTLLVVPQQQITDLMNAIDGCPVPHDEVLAIQDEPLDSTMEFPVAIHPSPSVNSLNVIDSSGWEHRPLSMFGIPRQLGLTDARAASAWLFAHKSGIRYAITNDLLFPRR
jgi:hypothetical protein